MTAVDMSMSYRGLEAMSPAGLHTHKDKEIAMGDFLFFSTFSGGQNDDPTPALAVPVPTSDMNTMQVRLRLPLAWFSSRNMISSPV